MDQLGDFDDAVKKVAELAKLKTWQLNWFVDEPSLSDLIFGQMSASVQAMLPAAIQAWIPAPISAMAQAVKDQPSLLSTLNDPQNRYALCLTCGDIR